MHHIVRLTMLPLHVQSTYGPLNPASPIWSGAAWIERIERVVGPLSPAAKELASWPWEQGNNVEE